MKLRLNTKYFRPRISIWSGFAGAVAFAFLTYAFLKAEKLKPVIATDNVDAILVLLLLLVATISFFVVGLAGIKTYREKFMDYDKARLKRKGLLPKLSVLGDWLIN